MPERLVVVRHVVPDLEAQQEVAAGAQDAVEPADHGRQLGRRDVDDRVPGHDPAQRAVGDVESGQVAHLERDPGVGPPRERHHRGRQVDPADPRAEPLEVGGDLARPAARVEDVGVPHHLGERPHDGAVHHRAGELGAEQLGVRLGDRVVTGTRRGAVRGFVHGHAP